MEKYTEQLSTSQKNLLFATQNGTFADVKILLNRSPSFAADETFSYVILVAALHRGHKSISTLLIQSGCRVTSSFKTNHYHTPLYYAIQSNDMNLFKILLKKKASLHATDANSQTPLELAMLAQESKFMDLILLNQDYGNINPNSRDDVAIFHLACYKGIVDIMKGFLQCEQIKCLLESCHGNSEDADRSMESKNGVLNTQEEDSDWISNRNNQARIITLLLEHGASVNAEDSMKMTPLSKACEIPSSIGKNSYVCTGSSKRFILDEIILRKKMMIDILLRHGADVNFRGTGGRSLLHTLFERSDKCREIKDLAEILLKGGADVDVTDDDGLSPLHLVIKNSTCHRFEFFIKLLKIINSKKNYSVQAITVESYSEMALKFYSINCCTPEMCKA
ncbi:hypothetical protein QAD02_006344 [Eretmocerus hayati]|uniref:Uncharacterized protein n=1 Tax=Eretmocerus hayati TaxID=131215 RepID=A0ACC2N0Q0_9HYME|nr:hypothetical protein QAD02_006344 [Eretmocerus hayati]